MDSTADPLLDFDVDSFIASGGSGKRPCDESKAVTGDDALLDFDVDAFILKDSPKKQRVSAANDYNIDSPDASFHPKQLFLPQALASSVASRPQVNESCGSTTIRRSYAFNELDSVLKEYYGFESYRGDQKKAIEALLQHKDVGIFWASGSGKSLVYVIPALVSEEITVVVSPLVSLMMDQCRIINNITNAVNRNGKKRGDVACFLGSGQHDASVERNALRGEYLIIYITPEKLAIFLASLLQLHQKVRRIGLLAVDESHCASQWGHDFRPAYANVGNFRTYEQGALAAIPIAALSATASKLVQADIANILNINKANFVPFYASLDRTNLQISVRCILQMGEGQIGSNLSFFLADLTSRKSSDTDTVVSMKEKIYGSTIIYATTTKLVDSIVHYLRSSLSASCSDDMNVMIRGYHAKMSDADRALSHKYFMVDACKIIVATVAFGMGIDKPDVRRIVHYGTPICLEDYYQQVGRAGRDGHTSQCVLLHCESNMNNYYSDFYTMGLSEEKKKLLGKRIEAMRKFASSTNCRRTDLLSYFEEPLTYSECNMCDNCCAKRFCKDDHMRDFSGEAMAIMDAIRTAGYKGASGIMELAAKQVLANTSTMKTKWKNLKNTKKVLESLLFGLKNEGYITSEMCQVATSSSYKVNYTKLHLTDKGKSCVSRGNTSPIVLPVPALIRQFEQEAKERVETYVRQLRADSTIDVDNIGEELEQEDGGIYMKWLRMMQHYRARGLDGERAAAAKETLLHRILQWRQQEAADLELAPENIVQETIVRKVAYANICSVEGLVGIGVRTRNVELLAQLMKSSLIELELIADPSVSSSSSSAGSSGAVAEQKMIFVADSAAVAVGTQLRKSMVQAPLLTKAGKPAKLPAWKLSYDLFAQHKGIESIAGQHPKMLQMNTVVGHLLDAFSVHGYRELDLGSLAVQAERTGFGPPNKAEYDKLSHAAQQFCVEHHHNLMAVTQTERDEISKVFRSNKTNILSAVSDIGMHFGPTFDFGSATNEVKFLRTHWFQLLNWFIAFFQAQYVPKFNG